jgi:predicted PurR-regulated permease PerM
LIDMNEAQTPPSHQPRPRPVWVQPLAVIFCCTVAVALLLYFFDAFSTVLLGALAAAIVASTLNPLCRFIPGPRGVSAALLGLGLIVGVAGLILGLSWPLADPIQRELHEWPERKVKIDTLLQEWSARLQLDEVVTVDALFVNVGRFFAGESGPRFFTRGADVLLAILIWLAFIFIGSIIMLADPWDSLLLPALRTASPTLRPRLEELLFNLGPRLRRWVIGTMISMCIVFTASLIGYSSIGLNFALPLAMLAGMCEIVPTVGPACAAIIAILFGATQSGQVVIGVICVYTIIQSIEAYVILPMIMRGAVRIHPAVTLFSVVLWGKIFGVPGMMLAIPINLTIASAVEHLYVRPRDRRLKGNQATVPAPSPPAELTV